MRFLFSEPPYTGFWFVDEPSAQSELLPGSIVAIPVTSASKEWQVLPDLLLRVRSTFATASIILRVEETIGPEVIHLARRAGRLHVRAVLCNGEPVHQTLRRILSQPEDLGADVAEWCRIHKLPLSPRLLYLIKEIVNRAPRHHQLFGLLESIGESASSVRSQFRKKRLPQPNSWLQAARALHAALQIQSFPDKSLATTALELGYADQSGLNQLLRNTCGTTPTAAREALGWEWLLDRWVRKWR